MLQPSAVFVKPIENYHLLVRFDTNEEKVFDIRPYISGSWFGKLGDKDYFNTVHIANQTVEWENGQDISPEELYRNSVPENEAVYA